MGQGSRAEIVMSTLGLLMEAPGGEYLVFGSLGLAWFLSLCQTQKGFFCDRIMYSHKFSHNSLKLLVFVVLHLTSNLDGIYGILVNCDS